MDLDGVPKFQFIFFVLATIRMIRFRDRLSQIFTTVQKQQVLSQFCKTWRNPCANPAQGPLALTSPPRHPRAAGELKSSLKAKGLQIYIGERCFQMDYSATCSLEPPMAFLKLLSASSAAIRKRSACKTSQASVRPTWFGPVTQG